ncbi:MAG TPA: chemotaxis protein CheW [Rhodocyclaceae bacterium]|nr:chemotaxis protein CheW [Rhodocyclaceae bacterium]
MIRTDDAGKLSSNRAGFCQAEDRWNELVSGPRASVRRLAVMCDQLVVFALDDQRYGLPLPAVERIVRVVEITALPQAPDIVLGVVGVQGRVIPVINLRRRFGLAERAMALSDQMVVARTTRRPVVLVVDAVHGVLDYPGQAAVAAQQILPGLAHLAGVAKLDDGLVLIQDLDRFLSLDEEQALARAMEYA